MKKMVAEALRDVRVVVISVLASTLVIGGTVVTTQLAAAKPHVRALAPGKVFTGEYVVGGGVDSFDVDDIKLKPMKYPIKGSSRQQIIPPGGPYTAQCPAVGQVVPRGFICVYERRHLGAGGLIQVADPSSNGFGTTKNRMFIIQFGGTGALWSYGSWAIRTGDATTARATGGARVAGPR